MLSFLDLSTATEEERCSINEILSDTSVVNFAEPLKQQLNQQTAKFQLQNSKSQSQQPKLQQHQPQTPQQPQQHHHHHHPHHHQQHHQQQPRSLKINNNNNNRIQHRHQHNPNSSHQNNYHNQHQPHPGVNNVIGVEVPPAQPAGYAVPPIPQQAHGFGPPPPPHHVYRGPPIFQPYPAHYFIPYNLPPYPLPPILLPPNNSVVPNRQQQQQSDEAIKMSPGGAIDAQTNLNVSKQSLEFCSNSSDGLRPGTSSGDCNDSGTEQSTQEPRENIVRAENT